MVYGGVSIQGKYHGVNQDSWLCREYGENACIMVVSDGLGSKKYSGQGSEAICESVFEVISTLKIDMNMVSFRDIIAMCHQRWKRKLTDLDYDIRQCCATMLVLVVTGDRVKAARLGDGFVAVCTENGIRVLFDEKEDCFANETDCLREELDREKIKILDEPFETFYGAIACTDGIEIGDMQEKVLKNFTRDFLVEYALNTADEIREDVSSWVGEWPGHDDKTLAFLINGNGDIPEEEPEGSSE